VTSIVSIEPTILDVSAPETPDPSQAGLDRFEAAFRLAARAHLGQVRKGTTIAYISHPMAVASLVLEDDGDEDEAIAALLHDVVEDSEVTVAEVAAGFGERVAAIVEGCTDAFTEPKLPWRERKEGYLARLPSHPEAWRVSLADKLHNARTIAADLRRDGVATLDRFNGGREGTLWYYRSLADFFAEHRPGPMQQELEAVVVGMEQMVDQVDHPQARAANPG
jgi:(p)ppGpp synthase/HD superfamily hydrolase